MHAVLISAMLCLSLAALPSMSQTKSQAVGDAAPPCAKSASTHDGKRPAQQHCDSEPAANAQVVVLLDHPVQLAAASTPRASDPSPDSHPGATPKPGENPKKAASTPLPEIVQIALAFTALVFALVAAELIVRSARHMRDEGLSFRRHWGGFGSTSTGWSMSTALGYLVVGGAMAFLSAAIALSLLAPNWQAGDTLAAKDNTGAAAKAEAPSVGK